MNFTQELFEYIKQLSELIPEPFETKYAYARRLRKSTYYGALSSLEKQGLIKKQKNSNKCKYIVTTKGKQTSFDKKKRSDGYLTGVIFDIPEYKKKQRNLYRRNLRQQGYKLLQKSVLVSEYEYSAELSELAQKLEIDDYIKILRVKIEY